MENCSFNLTNITADPSSTHLEYTYSYSRYICIKNIFPVHMTFTYLSVFIGILAIISRIIDRLVKYHSLFGRIFIISILWATGSSLLIHNTGLPLFVIISFIYLLTSITIGILCIWLGNQTLNQEIAMKIQHSINEAWGLKSKPIDMSKLKEDIMKEIKDKKTFWETYFSYRTFHGIFMVFAWYQMLGRLVVTNPSKWRGCWTYPSYKCSPTTFIDQNDPKYSNGRNETNMILLITIPAVLVIVVSSLGLTYFYKNKISKVDEYREQKSVSEEKENEKNIQFAMQEKLF